MAVSIVEQQQFSGLSAGVRLRAHRPAGNKRIAPIRSDIEANAIQSLRLAIARGGRWPAIRRSHDALPLVARSSRLYFRAER